MDGKCVTFQKTLPEIACKSPFMSDSTPAAQAPHITIALCTFNGAAHLREQLDSYLAQHHANWSLWISDDGSTDGTLEVIAEFARTHGTAHPVRVVEGPQKGVAANYLSLLCHPDFPAGLTALSDQDDVWFPEKLDYALQHIGTQTGPCLYGAQSVHVDDSLTPIGASSTRGATPGFPNALVQNIVSGHSAVLSPAALQLVRRAGVVRGIPYHDWWLYLLVTGASGAVVIDDRAILFYRQHADNLMGAHTGWRATWDRGMQLLDSTFRGWLDANTTALMSCDAVLCADARETLAGFAQSPRRPWVLARLGVRRQRPFSTACVYLAASLNRL